MKIGGNIAVTMGEPAGIGPDIILQLAATHPNLFSNVVVIGNQALLQSRAKQLKLSADLNVIDIPLIAPVLPGELDMRNARFVIDMLTQATQLALSKKISAIVTAPIHKGILNQAGFDIKGHTDFFAREAKCSTVMMMMTTTLKIALCSDHLPLREVPDFLTRARLSTCLDIMLHDFPKKFQIKNPRILMCGLNPHAGEQGILGREEIEVITPVIHAYQAKGYAISGPVGADVAFTPVARENADVIVALYHDQGLPIIKYAGFHEAINVTLGLPFVRTSVDHGTALTLAGTGKANTQSLALALQSAKTQFALNTP